MKLRFIYFSLLSVIAFTSYAQKVAENKAGKDYGKMAYVDAIKTYERIAEKGYKNSDMLQKIANAYYFNADLVNAEKWYSELFALTQNLDSEYYFRYAHALKATGNYTKADEMMREFNKKSQLDSRGKLSVSQKNYLEEIKRNSGRYEIDDAGINSEYSDYGAAFYGEKVVFTSTRDTGNFTKRKHAWTDRSSCVVKFSNSCWRYSCVIAFSGLISVKIVLLSASCSGITAKPFLPEKVASLTSQSKDKVYPFSKA